MPLKNSTPINPAAMRIDYSPMARAAQAKSAGLTQLSGAVKAGIGKAQDKRKKKAENAAIIQVVDSMIPEKMQKKMGLDIGEIAKNLDDPTEFLKIAQQQAAMTKGEQEKKRRKRAAIAMASQLPSLNGMTEDQIRVMAKSNPGTIESMMAGRVAQNQRVAGDKEVAFAANEDLVEREATAEENRVEAAKILAERNAKVADIANDREIDANAINYAYEVGLKQLGINAETSLVDLRSKLELGNYTEKQKADLRNLIKTEDAMAKRARATLNTSFKEALALSRERKRLETAGLTNTDEYTEIKAKVALHRKTTGIEVDDTSIRTKEDVMNNRDNLTVPKSVLEEIPKMDPVHWALYQVALQDDNIIQIREFHKKYPEFTEHRSKWRVFKDQMDGVTKNSLEKDADDIRLGKRREFPQVTEDPFFTF